MSDKLLQLYHLLTLMQENGQELSSDVNRELILTLVDALPQQETSFLKLVVCGEMADVLHGS